MAEYLYPGSLFPENVQRSLTEPTLGQAVAVQPDEEGYFRKDGWFAVKILSITEKRYTADGDETWVREGKPTTHSYIVGKRVHVDDIPDTDDNRILRWNISINSDDGFGVLTRCGNWQIASDYSEVIEL